MTRTEQAFPANAPTLARSLPTLGLAAIILLLAGAFVTGRNAQRALEAAEHAEIAQEDQTLCADLGFQEPDARHARCRNGLGEVRRKQKERWSAAFQ